MEYTTNELRLGTGNIINITNVDIVSYTQRDSDPDKATIVSLDKGDIIASSGTQFNIMKTFELRIQEHVHDHSSLTSSEKEKINIHDYTFFMVRSNFMIQNMYITSNYIYIQVIDPVIFFPVYIQDKRVIFKDLRIDAYGTMSMAYDPLNLYLENIHVNFYRGLGGFDMFIECNYPEASIDTDMHVRNVSFAFDNEKIVIPISRSITRSNLPGSFYVTDYYSDMYLMSNEPLGLLAFIILSSCTPTEEANIFYNITNATFPLPKDTDNSLTNYGHARTDSDLYRNIHINLDSINSSNYYNGLYGNMLFIGSLTTYLTIKGVQASVAYSDFSFYSFQLLNKIEVNDVFIEYTDAREQFIFQFTFALEIQMNNITIVNNDISSPDPTGIMYLSTFAGGTVGLKNIRIMNSDIGSKHAFEFSPLGPSTLTMSDVYASNVTLGTDTRIFQLRSLSSFQMSNCSFTEIHPGDSRDSSSKLIELSSISISDGKNFSIIDVQIEHSTVGLIKLSNIQSSENLTTNFFISNFTYTDSYFEFSQDLISFIQIETENNFLISISDIKMENITFVRTGNLFVFSQQTSTNLTFADAYFNNLNGARMSIKSSNLQNSNK